MRSQDPPFHGAEQALDEVGAIVAAAAGEARRAERYAAAVDALRVHGSPPDGADVRVTLDHAGGLVDLTVGEQVAARGGGGVTRAVLAANGVARSRLPVVLGALAREAFGPDSATTAHVVQHAERMFGVGATPGTGGIRDRSGDAGPGVLR
ncbi:MAG TPA: hypothetical protein VGE77_14040 [Nocardioides sp.]